jgi:hypothetical protein
MIQTTYKGMKVFANFDKTQCGLNIGASEGFFVTTEMENDIVHSPVFLQGPIKALEGADKSEDADLKKLYEEIKGEKYFIILKDMEYGSDDD